MFDRSLFLKSGCFLAWPEQDKIWCLVGSACVTEHKKQENTFYLNDFFLKNQTPWWSAAESTLIEMKFSEFVSLFQDECKQKPEIHWQKNGFQDYQAQFSSLMSEIDSRNLKKGVPYAVETAHGLLNQNILVYLICNLLERNQKPQTYLYGFWNLDQQQLCLGATPELLFVQQGSTLKTIAVAGTMEKGQSASLKLFSEHDFVIDGILSSLDSFGTLEVKETSRLNLSSLSHLKTDIFVNLRQHPFCFETFLRALHPTAALGTFPKKSGSHWLSLTEQHGGPRGHYAGVFGVVLGNHFSLCVGMIRCLQWNGNTIKITAGGGVIKRSQFDEEWHEICLKFEAIKQSLGV